MVLEFRFPFLQLELGLHIQKMVRGNWQKRIEKAQSRRHETKQNKIRKDSRGLHKSLVQEHLWPLLNHYSDDILRQKTGAKAILHLWVDSMPSSLNVDDSDIETSRNRDKRSNLDRKTSFGSDSVNSSKNRFKSKCEKNKHPRSHASSTKHAEVDENMLLCQQHFFNGRCSFMSEGKGSKRITCPYNHFSKRNGQQTLADVLCPTGKDRKKIADRDIVQITLNSSSIAAAAAFAKEEDNAEKLDADKNAIRMAYYLPINLFSSTEMMESTDILQSSNVTNSNRSKMKVTDFLQKALMLENCPSASIVYTVFNDTLIFDRYKGGILVDKEQESEIFLTGGMSNIDGRCDMSKGEEVLGSSSIHSLPGSVLEGILKFLPDEASGLLPMVCKSFSLEIGISSPSLWRYLISRRSWPLLDCRNSSLSSRNTYRDLFLSHYEVSRNVRCIENCVKQLKDRSDCDKVAFSAYSRIPISAHPWNNISVVAAEEYGCTLKLFEAAKSGTNLVCKEITSARIAPFPNSKKFCCSLMSMNLDDVYIACYFKTGKKGEISNNTWLVVVKRNDLLCHVNGANQESLDGLQKYDIHDYYLTHVRQNWSEDSNLSQYLNEYITNDGDLASINLSLFGNIEVCGNGLFMLLGKICGSNEHNPENWDNLEERVVLIMFSIPQELIVWSQLMVLDPEITMDVNHDSIIRSCVQNRSQSATSSTFLCCASVPIYLIRVETRSCKVTCDAVDERLVSTRNQALFPDSWAILDLTKRLSVVTKSHVVFADVLQLRYSSGVKVVLSFLPLNADASDSSLLYKGPISNLVIDKCHDVRSLHYDGSDHVIMQCLYKCEALVGHSEVDTYYTNLVVVHIPSQAIIHRCCLATWNGEDVCQLIFDGTKSESMALFIRLEGLAMTGSIIRNLAKVIETCPKLINKSPKKKKKKRLASKGGKKDGFARGISHGG